MSIIDYGWISISNANRAQLETAYHVAIETRDRARAELSRYHAAIQAVEALCRNNEPGQRYQSFEMTLRVGQVRAAIAAELEKP